MFVAGKSAFSVLVVPLRGTSWYGFDTTRHHVVPSCRVLKLDLQSLDLRQQLCLTNGSRKLPFAGWINSTEYHNISLLMESLVGVSPTCALANQTLCMRVMFFFPPSLLLPSSFPPSIHPPSSLLCHQEFEAELTRVAAEAAREVISRCQEGATGDEAKASAAG